MDHARDKRLQTEAIKKKISLSDQTLNYINKYQRTYKKVISEAQKRENDRIILRSTNHIKALWQIIKKESGNCHKTNQNISLEMGSLLVTNAQYISYQFNAYL
jgi:hypothetical protein